MFAPGRRAAAAAEGEERRRRRTRKSIGTLNVARGDKRIEKNRVMWNHVAIGTTNSSLR